LPDMDFRSRASSNFPPNIVSEIGSTDFVEALVGYRPRLRAMISVWISVVPPRWTELCSRSLAAPAAWSRASSAVRTGHGSGLWVVPSGLGGGFLSALLLSSAGRVRIVHA
jgi:hypothetical protein